MEHFTVDSDTFARFKQRFTEYLANGMPGVDPKLVNVMPLFANLRKIVPVFSCAAHPKPIGKEKPVQHAYFVLAVEDGGTDELVTFFKNIEERINTISNYAAYLQTTLVTRKRPFRWDYQDVQFDYYSQTLTFWPVKSEEMQNHIIEALVDTLSNTTIPRDELRRIQTAIKDVENIVESKEPSNYWMVFERGGWSKEDLRPLMEVKTPSLLRLRILNGFIQTFDVPVTFYGMYKKAIIDMYKTQD